MIRVLLFDLDETLYPPEAGIMPEIRKLMLHYLRTRLHLTPEEAEALRRHYFQTYGTTMRGLQINHHVDPDEFLRIVHDIPLEKFIHPNPELDGVLAGIAQDKVVFTNSSREHAERVLDLLGIRRHFSRIIDVRDVGYESKPQPAAYQSVCNLLKVRPEDCLIVEDNARNLRPAKALGMTTVLVHREGSGLPSAQAQGTPQDGSVDSDGEADVHVRRIEEIGVVVARIMSGIA